VNCWSENSHVKTNSPWVFLFFIYSFFHTYFCRFDVRCNNISVSVSSSESDSELRAMISTIAHFAGLQETSSQCALTLVSCSVSCAASPWPGLPCPVSAWVSMCTWPYSLPSEENCILELKGFSDLCRTARFITMLRGTHNWTLS
jgi:hypothetical protein